MRSSLRFSASLPCHFQLSDLWDKNPLPTATQQVETSLATELGTTNPPPPGIPEDTGGVVQHPPMSMQFIFQLTHILFQAWCLEVYMGMPSDVLNWVDVCHTLVCTCTCTSSTHAFTQPWGLTGIDRELTLCIEVPYLPDSNASMWVHVLALVICDSMCLYHVIWCVLSMSHQCIGCCQHALSACSVSMLCQHAPSPCSVSMLHWHALSACSVGTP